MNIPATASSGENESFGKKAMNKIMGVTMLAGTYGQATTSVPKFGKELIKDMKEYNDYKSYLEYSQKSWLPKAQKSFQQSGQDFVTWTQHGGKIFMKDAQKLASLAQSSDSSEIASGYEKLVKYLTGKGGEIKIQTLTYDDLYNQINNQNGKDLGAITLGVEAIFLALVVYGTYGMGKIGIDYLKK